MRNDLPQNHRKELLLWSRICVDNGVTFEMDIQLCLHQGKDHHLEAHDDDNEEEKTVNKTQHQKDQCC